MNIIILAAGRGTRLGSHNNNKPKCLFDIDGLSLIERNLVLFKEAGLNPILVTGYKKNKLDFLNLRTINNPDFLKTNMLWSLYKAVDYMDEDFIICYSDILVNKKLVEQMKNFNKGIGLIVDKDWLSYWKMRFNDPLDDAESLKISKKGNIISIGQKVNNIAEIEGQYIGFIKVSGKQRLLFKKILVDYCENVQTSSLAKKAYLTDFLQYLINKDLNIKEIPTHGGWIEIDSPSDVDAAKKSGRLSMIDKDIQKIMKKNNMINNKK